MDSSGINIVNLFWLLFLFSAFQPVIARKFLDNMRQRKIAHMQKARGSRVILLVHRQETMSFLGFPLMRYIDVNDSEELLRAIHTTDPDTPLDIIMHTPGGMVIAATQIARAVKAHPAKVTVFVPHFAMSGGTLIALAADEIVMSPHAVLGPVDPQLGGPGGTQPAASILTVIDKKPVKDVEDATIIMADQAAKAISQVRATLESLLDGKLPPEKAAELADTLAKGRWTHDHPIFATQAAELGLPVSTDIPRDVLEMMTLYPQPTQKTPSVEYLPRSGRE